MRLQHQFAHLRARWMLLVLVAVAAFTPAGFAQQSEPQPPMQSPASPNPATSANLADPAPGDVTESMFPHLKNTRYWLSGQANFVFQALPPFTALYRRRDNSGDPS